MAALERVLVSARGNVYYVRSLQQDFHTKEGFVKKEDLAAAPNGGSVTSNTGTQFAVMFPSFADGYARIARGPQVIPLKDLGFIAAQTGMNKESVVVDAGAGSGAAACFFASIAKEVFTFEVRQEFLEIAAKNIDRLGLQNVTLKMGSIYEDVGITGADVMVLDVPEPWNAIPTAKKALAPGGFLVSYSPTTPQLQDFTAGLEREGGFFVVKIVEIAEREWEARGRKVRPKSQPIGHSGFMVVARKISA